MKKCYGELYLISGRAILNLRVLLVFTMTPSSHLFIPLSIGF